MYFSHFVLQRIIINPLFCPPLFRNYINREPHLHLHAILLEIYVCWCVRYQMQNIGVIIATGLIVLRLRVSSVCYHILICSAQLYIICMCVKGPVEEHLAFLSTNVIAL